jgi:alkanesulfonate monooxygenase SsuD/methylene tetrahydromethanopterin reductase-like flavin-dependent oxidoreductase (luciferase family)
LSATSAVLESQSTDTKSVSPGRRPLKIGIMLPESEREMAGDTAGWSDFLDMARVIEGLGFDSLWFADHLYMKVEGHEPQGAWECWSMLAAFAAVTTRIELAPFVTCTGYRNPALIAKIAETVDEISGGRLILGLGAGWAEPEYEAFGFPFDHRAGRFEEALAIITGLIRKGKVDFEGQFYSARDCELRPRGPRPNGMPIMIGTFHGERMMRLTAQHADDWNVWAQWTGNRASGLPALRDKMDAICREVGRDLATLGRSAAVMVDFPGAYGRPGQTVPSLTGTPEELAEEFRAYAREGIGHLQLYPDPCTVAGIEALAPVLEILDKG